eukprot:6766931-Pyramimonas_sp.AAC.1
MRNLKRAWWMPAPRGRARQKRDPEVRPARGPGLLVDRSPGWRAPPRQQAPQCRRPASASP